MLENDFYTIVSSEIKEDTISSKILLNKNHQIFEGHFPENPVTPGVCMIQLVKEILEKTYQYNLQLSKISNVKFTALINPNVNQELLISTQVNKEDTLLKIKNVCTFTDSTVALKCNATFLVK
ncbi:3-hydroxyacyl-ACP dehydratase [Tenacibaculum caenipelagi]|uniref:3-hydroxyacyl-[acyl-carrier-protein] dehydratase n=1 Tax=Tenacibaculum caenipelagi TaxID=1325435 RepID=A0A4R6TEZ7_9FLAO|nr:3-hydroxyacyl-ACP dehydratase [Tenacibaculum caenipelagi]TDQ28865.1 3-hydroxyacyl-[acyl-carrier-protein] dehydratase [Tenacibaculum caenipelagi]